MRTILSAIVIVLSVALVMPASLSAQDAKYRPAPENLTAREWFQDAKFGLFVHWGVYSVLGRGEWVLNNDRIAAADYEKLALSFNPVQFNATEWVKLAKAAGMKYITITSKHHDGFAMFDSKLTDWDIVDRTPYKRDVLKDLAEACRAEGLKLFFYYSQLDWHNTDYWPRGRTGEAASRAQMGTWDKYVDFMDGQLKELLTNYGEIGGIWFDGYWDRPQANWRLDRTYKLIHSLQPQTLVGANHHLKPFSGEDFQMFEKDLPGQNTAGFNEKSEIGTLPLETCDTINGAWGYNFTDKRYKTVRSLIHYLVRAAGHNSNFLLNVGPMPTGKIQPEFVERLQGIGKWMEKYGESIYGTRGGPITPRPWGVTTRKGNTLYIHVLDWQDKILALPALPSGIVSAKYLKDGLKADITVTPDAWLLSIPKNSMDATDTIIVVELDKATKTE